MKLSFMKLMTTALMAVVVVSAGAQGVSIERLNDSRPIIDKNTFVEQGYPEEDGENINGPCLIKLPHWLKAEDRINPKAEYYLYFAHHKGNYLRLAWSEKITGPWFLVQDGKDWGKKEDAVFNLGQRKLKVGGVILRGHVASPMVIVDNDERVFKLYFHGPTNSQETGKNIGQKTYYATSKTGLKFEENLAQMYLGNFYFSPFYIHGRWHAFANNGLLYRAPVEGETYRPEGFDPEEPVWEVRNDFFDNSMRKYSIKNNFDPQLNARHVAQYIDGHIMHVFVSCREDSPERIYHLTTDISDPDFRKWKASEMEIALSAEVGWEGSEINGEKSRGGAARKAMNEVRDPFVYEDKNGELYLLYCAGGERGIGIAKLEIK